MSTKLFTVNENDLAELATCIMQWKNIHHMPVEDSSGKLLTWTQMECFLERQKYNGYSGRYYDQRSTDGKYGY
ncbi:hypothetical protein AAG747_27915 [Rapidithrix thailandica]|uniref:Uncharacterized protein n=1 Tax=Rapidithrix thailandica TaxID=413964 RepID=A0AAW9S3M3_9BACT